jgi:hypothetical protein
LPRYSHAVRRSWWILVAIVACGGSSPEVKQPPGSGKSHVVAVGNGSAAPHGRGSAAQLPVGDAPDIGCLTPSCAFHAGAAAYFTCLSGGAGACFHFGAPCTPADACMYDPGDRTYKQCAKPVEGACGQWGAACAPRAACMFDPADGLHHHCDDGGTGTCKRYGALCAP